MFWRGFRGEPKISFCLWFFPPRILLVASINHIYGNVVHEYKTLSRWLIAPYLWVWAHLQHDTAQNISLSFGLENIKAMDYRFKRGNCLTIRERKTFQFFVSKHSKVLLVSPCNFNNRCSACVYIRYDVERLPWTCVVHILGLLELFSTLLITN